MQTLKVFVASPGDVREEREIVGRVVERIEARYWNFVRLDSVRWESELVRATGHFNEEIVRPSECDVVMSILWRRLGSPMPPQFRRLDGTRYQSGTEWEIEDAIAGYEARRLARAEGRTDEAPFPDVLIFRRDAPAPADPPPDAADQFQRLEAFWRRFMLHPDGTIRRAYHRYASLKDFQRSVEDLLEQAVVARLPRLTATQEVLDPVPLQGSPFKGLAAFEAADAPLFFGREKSLGEALRQLRAAAGGGCPFLLIYGASGNGKSSLMKAGLTPRLTRPGWLPGVEIWRRAILLPGQGKGALAEKLASALRAALPAAAGFERLGEQLAAAPAEAAHGVSAALGAEAEGAGHPLEAARLLIEIDQLEEVFTAEETDDAGRDTFFAALAVLASRGAWIVATMRSEFFVRVARHPDLLRLVRAGDGHILTPPRPEDLARMVRCPAMAAGLGFQRHPQTAQDLSEAILDQAQRNPEALPLLQFCLQRLWEQREGHVLTWAAYEAMGGLEGAIARAADLAFAKLHPHEREAGRRVFAELVQVNEDDQPGEAGPAVRRRAPLEAARSAAPGADIFVAAFVGEKLLVTEGTAIGATLTLAHEALLTHWPELLLWVQSNRRLLAARRRLESAATEWAQANHDRGLLLRDRHLRDAEEVAESNLFHLPPGERSLLSESHRLQRRGRRIRQGVFAGAIVLAAAASVAAVLAAQNAARAVAARAGAEELVEFMTYNLRDRLEPIGRLALMDEVNQKVAEYHLRFAREDDAPDLRRRRAAIYLSQGDSRLAQGDLSGALKAYRDGQAISARLVRQDPNNPDRQRDLSIGYNKVARVLHAQGDLVGSLKAYRDGLAIVERLARQLPANAQLQRDLSYNHERVGDVLRSQGDLAGALKDYREGLTIRERLVQKDPLNTGWQNDLSRIYNCVADVLYAQDDLVGALKAYREGLAIAERLVQQAPANAPWQRSLAISFDNVADILRDQGDLTGALKGYRDSLTIRQRLVQQDPANTDWQRDLGVSYDRLSTALGSQGDVAGALKACRDGRAIAERLARQDPTNAQLQLDLATMSQKLGFILQANRAWREAADAFQRQLEIARPWLERPGAVGAWAGGFAIAAGKRWELLREASEGATGIKRGAALADLRYAVELQRRLDAAGRLAARDRRNLAWLERLLRETEK